MIESNPLPRAISWSTATLLALSMTMLGRALQISNGQIGNDPNAAIGWLSAAIAVAFLAVFIPNQPRINQAAFQVIATLCLILNFSQLVSKSPCLGMSLPDQLAPFATGFVVQALLCGITLWSEGRTRLLAFSCVLLVTLLLGSWAIINRPNPPIDVFVFQTDSSAALAEGHNPYAITFPDIYGVEKHLYGDGLVQNGRLQFGYPYFPETLLAVMPASLLHLDVRYAELAAIVGSAILIVCIRPGTLAFAAALLFVTTPRLFFVLEQSWIEPFVLLTLAATIACAANWLRFLPVALGLFLASKQYLPFAAGLFFVGSRPVRETTTLLMKAAAVALIVTLPFAVWNFPAFWRSVVALQFQQPFRPDSLSYLAWIGESFWPKSALVAIPFAALLSTMVLVLGRHRSIGFAAAVAVCFLVFFALSKQAFANYYFFVIGAMACAIVEVRPDTASTVSG